MGNTQGKKRQEDSMADSGDIEKQENAETGQYSGDIEKQENAENEQYQSDQKAQVAVEVRILSSTRIKEKSHFEFDVDKMDNVRVTGMAAIEYDRLLLCNNKDKCLLIYSLSGKYMHTVNVLSFPFDVAVLPDRKRAVISFQQECQVQFIDLSPSFITAANKMDIVNPSTGGISTYDDKIAIAKRHGIDIYSTNGSLVESLESSIDHIYFLKYSDDFIAYTDCKNLVVKGLKSADKLRYGNVVRDRVVRTEGMVFDNIGNVYSTNYAMNELFIRAIKQRHSQIFLTEEDGLYGPRAICISGDYSTLYIANNDGQSIYVYKL